MWHSLCTLFQSAIGGTVVGYVDDPKANSEILVSGGWLRTGDVCYIDEQGFLFVVDRVKEMIKYKGYQVIINLCYTHFEYLR